MTMIILFVEPNATIFPKVIFVETNEILPSWHGTSSFDMTYQCTSEKG